MTTHDTTQTYPLLPLRQGVLFPSTSMALGVGRPQSLALLDTVTRGDRIAVGFQRDAKVEDPSLADLLPVGVIAEVLDIHRRNGGVQLMVRAKGRQTLLGLTSSHPFWRARLGPFSETNATTTEARALAALITDRLRDNDAFIGERLAELLKDARVAQKPGVIADIVVGGLGLSHDKEALVLLESDVEKRLHLALRLLSEAEELADVKSRLSEEVKKQLGEHQRKAILREQLRAIRKELDEDDDDLAGDDDSLADKLDELDLPDEVRTVVKRELRRLETSAGMEQQVVRSYLELIAELPWREQAPLKHDIEGVSAKLDSDHYGLDDVKERILEHLAVNHRVKSHRGAIMTLVGPPGVGKTSLGQSIAEATGRPFVRIALGGVRDEAEIRGHRRTYVGALPGRIIQALRSVKVKNPLILLDEVDKLGQGWMGSPEAALLELLDPEQNRHFTDHYLELPFDLSEVLFLCTANTLQTLSAPLKDRLEIIELKGYTPREKRAIAREHLLPKHLAEHALCESDLRLDDETLDALVTRYTRESGVRQLSRELTRVCRAVVLRLAREAETKIQPLEVSPNELEDMLGKPRFHPPKPEQISIPGIATGLAWTPVGGDVLFVESSRMVGKGRVEITGQLGDVMKESARAAASYLRSHAAQLDLDPKLLEEQDVHVHVPAGAVPKDGPSAGITMLTALASLFTNRVVRADTAMTGELTLRGRVLPVGGIKEKVLAAHRQGLRRIILSEQNRRDIDEVPEDVKNELSFIFADDVDTVLEEALGEVFVPLSTLATGTESSAESLARTKPVLAGALA